MFAPQPSAPLLRPLAVLLVAVVALLGATATSGAAPTTHRHRLGAPAKAVQLSKADREFVDRTVAAAMGKARLPGVSITITGPKGRYVKTYGVADRSTGRALTVHDHVRIASITKSFTATAVLQQIERGTIKMSDKLSQWVQGIPHGRRITVRQLLAMRTGIYDFTSDPSFTRRFDADPLMRFKPRQVVRIIKRHEPLFQPGERTQYADSNYVLLGIILRAVTGRSIAKVITDDVIRPSGLGQTTVPVTPAMPRPFSRGYYAGDDGTGEIRDYTKVNPKVAWTAGNMISTLGNLKRWGRILATGTLLSKRMQAERLHFGVIPNQGGPPVGYGLGIMRVGDWIGHDGAIFGFSTVTMMDPSTGAQFAAAANLSSNFSTPTIDMFAAIARHLYPNSLKNQG